MAWQKGDIVGSMAGSDKGTMYLAVDVTAERMLLVDGRRHGFNKLKFKNFKHCQKIATANRFSADLAEAVKAAKNLEAGRQANALVRKLLKDRRQLNLCPKKT